MQSHSPPPLRHPVPTHPTFIPEPPPTPNSPQGYQRYSSTPTPPIPHNPYQQQHQQHQQPHQVPAYTSPFQHSQPSYGQPHQQHHAQQSPMPDFAAWGVNDATAQFGMQLGQSAVAAGQDYVHRNFGTIFPSTTLKYHFNVSNTYVINKIKMVLFPWLHKPWGRKVKKGEQGQATEWQSPREDLNSPDLYIPAMAIVTYILLCALHAGLRQQFHPTVLGEAASRAVVVLLLDFAFIKLGCYILNVQSPSQLFDIVAYSGYKFVGVIFALTGSFLKLSSVFQTVLFLYAFFANAFFLLRSLRSVILPDSHAAASASTANTSHSARRRRIALLFIVAVSQVLYMGMLVRIQK